MAEGTKEVPSLSILSSLLEGTTPKSAASPGPLGDTWVPKTPPFLFVLFCDAVLMKLSLSPSFEEEARVEPDIEPTEEANALEGEESGNEVASVALDDDFFFDEEGEDEITAAPEASAPTVESSKQEEAHGGVEELSAASVEGVIIPESGTEQRDILELLPPKVLVNFLDLLLALLIFPTFGKAPVESGEAPSTVEDSFECVEEEEVVSSIAAVAADDDFFVEDMEDTPSCGSQVARNTPSADRDMARLRQFVEDTGEKWRGEDDSYLVVFEAMAMGIFVDDDGQASASESAGFSTETELGCAGEDSIDEEYCFCDACMSDVEAAECHRSAHAHVEEPKIQVRVC